MIYVILHLKYFLYVTMLLLNFYPIYPLLILEIIQFEILIDQETYYT